MPIRYVVSGFFRSGTTFLWSYLRRELHDTVCFYEPLHHELPSIVTRHPEPHADHGVPLWTEYADLDAASRATLWDALPRRRDPDGTLRYLDVFHAMSADVLLQPCRASFILDRIADRYSPRLIHLIRDPRAVIRSMRRLARGGRSPATAALRRPLRGLRTLRGFDLYDQRRQALRHRPDLEMPSTIRAALDDASLDDLVLSLWTHANAAALDTLERHGGRLLVYEAMLADPTGARRLLERGLGRDLTADPPVTGGRSEATSVGADPALERLSVTGVFSRVRTAVLEASGVDYAA